MRAPQVKMTSTIQSLNFKYMYVEISILQPKLDKISINKVYTVFTCMDKMRCGVNLNETETQYTSKPKTEVIIWPSTMDMSSYIPI